jgi:hypothetical protein
MRSNLVLQKRRWKRLKGKGRGPCKCLKPLSPLARLGIGVPAEKPIQAHVEGVGNVTKPIKRKVSAGARNHQKCYVKMQGLSWVDVDQPAHTGYTLRLRLA